MSTQPTQIPDSRAVKPPTPGAGPDARLKAGSKFVKALWRRTGKLVGIPLRRWAASAAGSAVMGPLVGKMWLHNKRRAHGKSLPT